MPNSENEKLHQEIERLKEQPPKQKWRWRNCCSGCGCVVPLTFLLLFLAWAFTATYYRETGEHLQEARSFGFSVNGIQASNCSYYWTYLHQYGEFDISSEEFAKIGWFDGKPVDIEKRTEKDGYEIHKGGRRTVRINIYEHGYPYFIQRYNRISKPEHKDCKCDSYNFQCKIDPTGRTDDSCYHLVSHGYYYERSHDNGGGVYVLYDTDNHRCYYEGHHH